MTRSSKNVAPPDRPIFLVGCAKSGTSVLGILLMAHPDIGPKSRSINFSPENLQPQIDAMLDDAVFGRIAAEMEQKQVWDRFFPVHGTELRVGKELTLLTNPLSESANCRLWTELTRDFSQPRFFSKAPFNTFRLHVLRELFPDAKLIAIHRDGRDVIASWGRKQNRWQYFGGYENAIRLFARKWNEAVDHIENYRHELNIKVVQYEDLIRNPQSVLGEILDFCELPYPEQIYDPLRLGTATSLWRERIPEDYHDLTESLTCDSRLRVAA